MSPDERSRRRDLTDLCYKAYVASLCGEPVNFVLDRLQNAYWEGLDQVEEFELEYGPNAEPPF